MTDLLDLLTQQVADNEVTWSLGTFGALAEFTRDVDEPVELEREDGAVSAVTHAAACVSRSIRNSAPLRRSRPPAKAGAIASRSACRKRAAR